MPWYYDILTWHTVRSEIAFLSFKGRVCFLNLLQAHPRFGETQVVKTGPLAAPSRVFAPGLQYERRVSCIFMWSPTLSWSFLCFQAGVYRIAGAVLTGAGNATIGIGGTVEGITSEATGPHQ